MNSRANLLVLTPLVAGPFLLAMTALGKIGLIPSVNQIDESRPMQVAFLTIVTSSTLAAFMLAMSILGR